MNTKTEQLEEIRKIARAILDGRADPVNASAMILDVIGNGPGCEPGVPLVIDYTDWRGERADLLIFPTDLWYGASDYHSGYQWYIRGRDEARERNRTFGDPQIDLRDFALLNIHAIKKERPE